MTENADQLGRRLRKAVKDGDLQRCRALILAGADMTATDVAGRTLLHAAADLTEDCPEIVRLLIEAGAPVNAGYGEGQTTALHLAAHHGHAETVRALLEAGADVNARASYGRTPLHMAALMNRLGETIAVLMTRGADAQARDDDDRTAAELANHEGHTGVEVQIMGLEAGVRSGWIKSKTDSADDG